MPRHLSQALAVAAAVAGTGAVATYALADVARFTPALIVEQLFTDNVRADSEDKDADAVTTVGLRISGEYESARVQVAGIATAYYNEYWATNEFDDFNGDGAIAGRLVILEDRFFIDAQASRQEVFVAPDETAGSGLSTGSSNTRQTEYSVGPLLTLNMFDLADLAVRGTYAKVMYDEPLVGPLLVPIDDVTAKSAAGRITTGERHSNYELIGTAEYLETEDDFELRNAVGHVIVNLTPSFSAIGRYGYERISDPSIALMRGPRWSVGGRYSMSNTSYIQLEYGERFDDTNWSGVANFLLSPRILFNAEYSDTLLPAQLSRLRPLDDIFDDDGNLSLQSAPPPFLPSPTLVDQVVRDKNLRASTTYTRGLATYSLTGAHAERQIPGLGETEKIYRFDLEWRETMSRSLTGLASAGFYNNYDPSFGTEPLQQYRAELGFIYLFNTDVTFNGSYIWTLSDRELSGDTQINVLRFGMIHAL